MYGDNGLDTVMSHIRAHLPHFWRAHEKWGGEMYFIIHMNEHSDKEPLIEMFRDKMKLQCIPMDFAVMLSYDQPELVA